MAKQETDQPAEVNASSIRDLVDEDENAMRDLEILIRQELNPELQDDWVAATLRLIPPKLISSFQETVRHLIDEMQDEYKESEQTSAGKSSSV